MTPGDFSVVIPTLDEESNVVGAVESAFAAGSMEVIVVDGGSNDGTLDRARRAGVTKVVRSLPGRGVQLNSGALLAERDYVLFLHADNRLTSDCLRQVCDAGAPDWGAFRQRIESDRRIFRLIERGNALRVTVRGIPFGDQAVFVRKSLFDRHGRFDEVPLMEDVNFAMRMRRVSKPVLLQGPVIVDARRWQKRGPIRQTLRNWKIQVAHRCGVSPRKLANWYR